MDEAGKAGPEQSLPPPPALLAPSHQAEITYPDPSRATTLLVWAPVPGAAAYHVMLDYSPYFNRPLVDRARHPDTSVELRAWTWGSTTGGWPRWTRTAWRDRSPTSRASR